jgi:flagellar biogenesis protein FliO
MWFSMKKTFKTFNYMLIIIEFIIFVTYIYNNLAKFYPDGVIEIFHLLPS